MEELLEDELEVGRGGFGALSDASSDAPLAPIAAQDEQAAGLLVQPQGHHYDEETQHEQCADGAAARGTYSAYSGDGAEVDAVHVSGQDTYSSSGFTSASTVMAPTVAAATAAAVVQGVSHIDASTSHHRSSRDKHVDGLSMKAAGDADQGAAVQQPPQQQQQQQLPGLSQLAPQQSLLRSTRTTEASIPEEDIQLPEAAEEDAGQQEEEIGPMPLGLGTVPVLATAAVWPEDVAGSDGVRSHQLDMLDAEASDDSSGGGGRGLPQSVQRPAAAPVAASAVTGETLLDASDLLDTLALSEEELVAAALQEQRERDAAAAVAAARDATARTVTTRSPAAANRPGAPPRGPAAAPQVSAGTRPSQPVAASTSIDEEAEDAISMSDLGSGEVSELVIGDVSSGGGVGTTAASPQQQKGEQAGTIAGATPGRRSSAGGSQLQGVLLCYT